MVSTADGTDQVTIDLSALVSSLALELVDAPSGVRFVYQALDRLRVDHGVEDAVLAIEEPSLGRQLFRTGRRPPLDAPFLEGAPPAREGVFSGEVAIDDSSRDTLLRLCAVALRLDVLRHDAQHDALTGLLNRRSFDDAVIRFTSRADRYGWPFALALLDLDDFKALNDRLGHAAGDATLRDVGAALRRSLRLGDVAARVGGDEFALILADGDAGVASGLFDRVHEALRSGAEGPAVGFSIGIAFAPLEATTVDDLYRLADRRLYEAKAR